MFSHTGAFCGARRSICGQVWQIFSPFMTTWSFSTDAPVISPSRFLLTLLFWKRYYLRMQSTADLFPVLQKSGNNTHMTSQNLQCFIVRDEAKIRFEPVKGKKPENIWNNRCKHPCLQKRGHHGSKVCTVHLLLINNAGLHFLQNRDHIILQGSCDGIHLS